MSLYSTYEDLAIRILEIRRIKELLSNEEEWLIQQRGQLEDKRDCMVDLKGRVIGQKQKKKETVYRIVKAQEDEKFERQKKIYKSFGVPIKK